jgi:DHA1 family quinolone resistance protein-like MFS transporter
VSGFGLVEPILAIFIKDSLEGGTVFAAGIASGLFLITKSIVQIPFSRRIDSNDQNHSVRWLMTGVFFVSLVPVLYIFATHIAVIYVAQVLFGVASGLAFPAWLRIWNQHLDENQESFEWSVYSALVGVGTAMSAGVGGAIAQFVGFQATFLLAGLMSLGGFVILFRLNDEVSESTREINCFPKVRQRRQKPRRRYGVAAR